MQKAIIDLSKNGIIPVFHAKQGDTSRRVAITLLDNGLPYDTAADAVSVWYSGPSGEGNYSDGIDKDGSTLTILINPNMTAASGRHTCAVMLSNESGRCTTWNFCVEVAYTPALGSEEAKAYFEAFEAGELAADIAAVDARTAKAVAELNARVSAIIASGTATEGNTELIDIRTGADGKVYPTAGDAVRGQIGELNGDLVNLYDVSNIAMYPFVADYTDYTNYISGSFADKDNGSIGESENAKRTDYINIDNYSIIRFSSFAIYSVAPLSVYDENYVFLGSEYNRTGTSEEKTDIVCIISLLKLKYRTAKYVVISTYGPQYHNFYVKLSSSTGNLSKPLTDYIEKIELLNHYPHLKNETTDYLKYQGTPNISEGFMDTSGNVEGGSAYFHTDKIEVSKNDVISGVYVRSDGFTSNMCLMRITAFNGNIVIPECGATTSNNRINFIVPNDDRITHIVVSSYSDYSNFQLIVKTSININSFEDVNKLCGKTVYSFGDSLIYGHVEGVGMLDGLCRNENMPYYKYAMNGAKITGQWEILKQIVLSRTEEPDFVVFDGGTNDAFQTVPLGEFSESFTNKGYSDFTSAFDTVCNNIRVKFPNTKIIYVTAHKMPTISYNAQKEYYEKAIQVCDKYSITVVDIYKYGQINTWIDSMRNEWSTDTLGQTGGNGTHLTSDGYAKFYAPLIKAKMIELLN